MVDIDTFLTILYVIVDDFCKSRLIAERRPGPKASLSRSETVTLAIVAQWAHFQSERGFYRYAKHHLLAAFPTLPHRTQLNRLMRYQRDAITAFFVYLATLLEAQSAAYEALDTTGVPTRAIKRRGAGWLPGLADIGWSNRLGWYEGFHLLTAVTPTGVVTGFGFAPASTKDQPMAESFFALRAQPHPRLLSPGEASAGPYVADKGFEGKENHRRWSVQYKASLISPPKRNSRHPWPKSLRRWLASIRQIVETAYDKLFNTLRLDRERPHELDGFQTRLAAKFALHNFCIWLNQRLGRPNLSFADLLDW
jgi:hypothetical protein